MEIWESRIITKSGFLCYDSKSVCTRLVHDIDWSAGGGAVSSTSHSVDGDGVVGTGPQVSDFGGGLRARHCELLRITVTSWIENDNVMHV